MMTTKNADEELVDWGAKIRDLQEISDEHCKSWNLSDNKEYQARLKWERETSDGPCWPCSAPNG